MDIYEYAMKMEKDGENYYRELAANSGNEGVRNILNMLADEEVKHFHVLQQMKSHEGHAKLAELADSKLLGSARNIFTEMREKNSELVADEEQARLYRSVQETEKQSYHFYLEKSEAAGSEAERELLLRIAEEEKRHMFLMGNIADFVARPAIWLEDAEFNHLEEY